MYEAFYGLKEKPFGLSPDPEYLFMSKRHERVYTHLRYAIRENKGLVVITGEIGSGKTTLLNFFLPRLKGLARVIFITNTTISPAQFLKLFCRELGVSVKGLDKVELLKILEGVLHRERANRRRIILVMDEAQNLSFQTLEELRLLLNLDSSPGDPLLQIILVGQPELKRKLQHPSMKQFVQRITVYCHLEPLGREEVAEYIRYRLKRAGARDLDLFTEEAIEAIYQHSRGIPRLINIICDTALVYGFADELPRIDREIIETVVKDRLESGFSFEGGREPVSVETKSSLPSKEWDSRLKNLEDRIRILESLVADISEHLKFYHRLEREWEKLTRLALKALTGQETPSKEDS